MENEQELFSQYRDNTNFVVAGFSYGSIKAIEYALSTNVRIDKIQLFSPSYFNDKDTKYKRMQLIFFKKDKLKYSYNFLKNCGFSEDMSGKYSKLGKAKELDELLNYKWSEDKLIEIVNKGINIEVFLGANDLIINSQEALEFFKKFGEVYYLKNRGHILRTI
ncbi:MAG: pimelyl-ACP methyl ester esterase BioV [Campylobacterota bacterium]|nr:pimelyl-ACP methyl ester esterase BioV [Campylobacterota bacterium]